MKPIVSDPNVNYLKFIIKKIHICDSKYLNDRSEIPFIVESDKELTLFYVDLKESKIIEKNVLKLGKVVSTRFIYDK